MVSPLTEPFFLLHALTPGHVSASDSHPVKGWDEITPIGGCLSFMVIDPV